MRQKSDYWEDYERERRAMARELMQLMESVSQQDFYRVHLHGGRRVRPSRVHYFKHIKEAK